MPLIEFLCEFKHIYNRTVLGKLCIYTFHIYYYHFSFIHTHMFIFPYGKFLPLQHSCGILFFKYFQKLNVFVFCVSMCGHECPVHMEIRGKLTVVSSLLSPCGTQGSISGHQAHLQMPFVCLFWGLHLTLSLTQAWTHYAVQACLKLVVILLLQLPKHQSYKCKPPCWPSSYS